MKVLVTGFEPFDGAPTNPSWDAAKHLASLWTGPADLVTACLPVVFAAAEAQLRDLLADHRPDLVIALGLASGRAAITPEKIAINLMDARIPDNSGQRPRDLPSVPGAPDAYFSTLPVKAIVAALHEAGIPAALSFSAGTFVCNHVFFALMHALRDHPGTRAGFIHVPAAPAEALDGRLPTMPVPLIAQAVRLAILACIAEEAELAEADISGEIA